MQKIDQATHITFLINRRDPSSCPRSCKPSTKTLHIAQITALRASLQCLPFRKLKPERPKHFWDSLDHGNSKQVVEVIIDEVTLISARVYCTKD